MIPLGAISSEAMLAIRDRYFAPSLLAPFADDMARRLARFSNGPMLETSAGTGSLTQAIASSMSAGLTIVSTDPSAEMVAYASARPGMARIAWQQADPCALPFRDGAFGIVVSHFGIPAVPDRVRAFKEARRVMKPEARFTFSVPGPIKHNPVARCLQDALEAMFPNDPPEFVRTGLHGYADNEAIDNDLTAAGFPNAIYTPVELPFAAASAKDVAIGYCLGTSLRSEIEVRTGGDCAPTLQAATQALEKRFGSGTIKTTMRAHIISASG